MGESKRKRIVGYKHVNPRHADAFEAGASIVVGTLDYYRTFESDRRDPEEGRVTHNIEFLEPAHYTEPEYAAARQVLKPMLGDLSKYSPLHSVFHNNTIIYTQPPTYIFCCSDQPDEYRMRAGEIVFELSNVALFGQMLREAHPDLLQRSECRPVRYGPRAADPFGPAGPLPTGPFEKSNDFRHENEIRIAWRTTIVDRPCVKLSATSTAKLIRRVN